MSITREVFWIAQSISKHSFSETKCLIRSSTKGHQSERKDERGLQQCSIRNAQTDLDVWYACNDKSASRVLFGKDGKLARELEI